MTRLAVDREKDDVFSARTSKFEPDEKTKKNTGGG